MDADLVDVKQLFSNMMKRVQPWVLSHFIMWLDLKVAEYKVLGYMVLDKKSVYDKEQLQTNLQPSLSSRPATSSPASATSSEHMYVVPAGLPGRQNPSPGSNRDSNDTESDGKRKSITTTGTFIPEKADVFTKGHKVHDDVYESSSQDITNTAENRTMENGSHVRKQRKPGKVLHSIVNNLKQNCNKISSDSEPCPDNMEARDNPNPSLLRNELEKSSVHSGYPVIRDEYTQVKHHVKGYITGRTQNNGPECDRREPMETSLPKSANQEPEELSGDNTPLYKSQQFSSLISLSRSRGRRRRSSNDEITYPLITTTSNKEADTPQVFDEPRPQNLADFYFAQNQLDEQFAVRRARQNVCRMSSKVSSDKDGTLMDSGHMQRQENNISKEFHCKQERIDSDNAVSSTSYRDLSKGTELDQTKENGTNSNVSSESGRSHGEPIFVKTEPLNDDEYDPPSSMGQSDRLSNQSFSSEGDTTSYRDNSLQYDYHGDDIADESFTLSNHELYGDDYVGSPHGTPGTDYHDNKMMRPKSYKKRPVTPASDPVPRDPNSGKFVCELCGGTFTNRSSYFRHKRIHGEKKYRCFLCDKAFHRKEHLQSHIHRHTKYFPLKCCKCAYESHSLDEASSHFHAEHNNQDTKESP